MRWVLRLILLATGLAACGCAALGEMEYVRNGFKVGPNYIPPQAPVAPQWIEGSDPRTQAAPPRDGDWWEVFQDPILNGLICKAYQQNPNLKSVGARVLESRAQRGITVGNLFPQSQNLMGYYATGRGFGFPSNIDLTTFNLSWEIDFWGRYRRQIETATAKLDQSVDNYDDALVTLLADVATNYVQYRVAQQRIEIARENLRTQERLVELAEEQRKVGTGTTLDVEQFRTLMEQTKASIPVLQTAMGQANDQLCVLLGTPPHDLATELGAGPNREGTALPAIPTSVAAGIPADLITRRPDIRAAERQVAAQNAQIGVAVAGFFPSISIGTMLGYADLGLPPFLAEQGFLAFFTPQFTWNILNYGRIRNNVRLQKATAEEYAAAYQNRVLTAAGEVQTALRGFLLTQDQANALARSAAAATNATRIEEKLFIDIKADVNRLFTLESSLLQAQDQLAVARGNIALNLINVYRALGGGWEIRRQEGYCRTIGCGQTEPTVPAPMLPPGTPAAQTLPAAR